MLDLQRVSNRDFVQGLLYQEIREFVKGNADINSTLRKTEKVINKLLASEMAK